ncbi:MAG TPA: GTP-binding protein, partial [Tenuifilaceae bacterium]|nr:GTP-binding protein [Tenuifilaceae bacterium]
DRSQLRALINSMLDQTTKLMESFKFGNVIKQGVPVAIVGKPNVGKSTLLNRILNEEKAIVSEIAGTTRDSIEDTISIKGVNFRFIDTAGLRHTTDTIESIGIERAYQKIAKARIVLVMLDAKDPIEELVNQIENLVKTATNSQQLIALLNKADMVDKEKIEQVKQTLKLQYPKINSVEISAKHNQNIDRLIDMLAESIIPAIDNENTVIVTNARHYESLYNAKENLERAINALDKNIPTDLLAMDIRQVLHYIGEITGQITTDEILGSIFSKFCIGK